MKTSPSPARAVALRCEHLPCPLGLDEPRPRFSWQMRDARTGARQIAYELAVTSHERVAPGQADVWSSGRIDCDATHLIPYDGPRLRPHTRYVWRVRLWDHTGCVSPWSEPASWTTGFLGTRWPAEWIGLPTRHRGRFNPVRYLRHAFELSDAPVTAYLHVTALGLFEAHVNGAPVGTDLLTPGWTDYRRRVEYLTYDVTAQLRPGRNVLGALLADGWYSGRLLWHGQRGLYGPVPALRAVLRVTLADGSTRVIGTSPNWNVATGAFLAADLYDGETYDARRELTGWSTAAFDDRAWVRAHRIRAPDIELNAKQTPPIRAVEELAARAVTEPVPGRFIFDLGQNMVGVARLRVRAPAGTRVTLRYGEMLNPDGTLYTANLRSARATDEYICRGAHGNGRPSAAGAATGNAEEIYQPRFTFHGFRYVEVSGLTTPPTRATITGIVLHSDLPPGGRFTCSDRLINRLQENIRWGQRGNFLDVPTDCPQRDERLGWTGDAQVFVRTASFNLQVASFFRKWLRDLRDGQHANGSFPDVAPDVIALAQKDKPHVWPDHRHDGNAAWADAGVICPWVIYERCGDRRVLEENYSAMCSWIEYQRRTSRNLVRPRTAYGDWLATDAVTPFRAPTPGDLIGTAYFAETTRIVARVAALLRRDADARRYRALHRRIVAAFRREFVTANGRVAGDTQTGYLLALAFDLLLPAHRARALDHLVADIERHGNCLSTGFVGTPLLCPVLSRFGRNDIAYRLLFQRGYPSWLYPVCNGATTMWERWNSWTRESGFANIGMNSFNHYAYGAVGEWLYATVGGVDVDPEVPAYKRIRLRLVPCARLRYARLELNSPHGRIRSAWRLAGRRLTWEVEIPANTSASARLPVSRPSQVTLNGRPAVRNRTIGIRPHPSGLELEIPAGRHTIVIKDPTVVPAPKPRGVKGNKQ